MFFGRKKAQKTFPPKLIWKTLANLNIQTMELELPNFSLNLGFGNFNNETPNKRVKKMSEEELDKSVAGQHNLHYVSGKHGLNFPGFWNIFNGRYVQQRETNSNRPHWKPFNDLLTVIYRKKNAGFSIIRDEEFPNADKALDAKVKFLKQSGKSNKPNGAEKGFTHILPPRFVTLLAV